MSLAGLGVGLLVIAFLVLSKPGTGTPGTPGPLIRPAASYGAENPDQSLGSLNAPVTVTMWGDFQCPACAVFEKTLEPQLISTYVGTGKVKFVFRTMAFLGRPSKDPLGVDESLQAAMAARCSGQQGHFWPYQGYLYANQGPAENAGTFSTERLDQIARAVGLDMTAFDACLSGGATRSAVQAETAQGDQIPIIYTPTIFVASHKFEGVPTWDQLSAAIEAQLASPSSR